MPIGNGIGLGLQHFPMQSVSSAAPAAPTGLASTPGDQILFLVWDDVVGVTWTVYRSLTDDFGTAFELGEVGQPAFDDTAGPPGTKYFYWVAASEGGSESDPSASVAGRAYIICPDGGDSSITIPPGSWTLGTVFFGSTLPDNLEFLVGGGGGDEYTYAGGNWVETGTLDPANSVPVSGDNTIRNLTGQPATLWDGEPP